MKKHKEVIKCNLFKEIDSWITIKMAITNILVMEIHNTKMINMKLKIKANTMMVMNNLMLNQHQTKTNWHKTVIKINRFIEINKITFNKIKEAMINMDIKISKPMRIKFIKMIKITFKIVEVQMARWPTNMLHQCQWYRNSLLQKMLTLLKITFKWLNHVSNYPSSCKYLWDISKPIINIYTKKIKTQTKEVMPLQRIMIFTQHQLQKDIYLLF